MNIKDRVIFWGHYDDIEIPECHSHSNYGERFDNLNIKKDLTELEQKEIEIMAYGTEEEYRAFLREHGDKKKS